MAEIPPDEAASVPASAVRRNKRIWHHKLTKTWAGSVSRIKSIVNMAGYDQQASANMIKMMHQKLQTIKLSQLA